MKKLLTILINFLSVLVFAQETETVKQTVQSGGSFFTEVVFGSGFLGGLIWLALFMTSTIAISLIVYLILALRKSKFGSEQLLDNVRNHIASSDLNSAYSACDRHNSVIAEVLCGAFKNYHRGEKVMVESAGDALGKSGRAIQRQIGALQMCGNIAPMLGLLGTVTGMVSAFMGLGTAMGPEKASVLAISISQALYTTAAGLVIAIPALAASTICTNLLEKRLQESNEYAEDILSSVVAKFH
ncbi:MAG: MotA/TolQ/ExbB proton channel family protein [Victivallaceae bacterium]